MNTIHEDHWVFLIDPAWVEQEPSSAPPLEAVVGGWLVTAEGGTRRFQANSDYEPSQPGSPTDPVDAALQLLVRGEADSDALFSVVRESVFAIALDGDGEPVVAPSPDGVPSLLVSTAPAQRSHVVADGWREEVPARELSALLELYRVDLLLNPGGPASVRLVASAFAEGLDEMP